VLTPEALHANGILVIDESMHNWSRVVFTGCGLDVGECCWS